MPKYFIVFPFGRLNFWDNSKEFELLHIIEHLVTNYSFPKLVKYIDSRIHLDLFYFEIKTEKKISCEYLVDLITKIEIKKEDIEREKRRIIDENLTYSYNYLRIIINDWLNRIFDSAVYFNFNPHVSEFLDEISLSDVKDKLKALFEENNYSILIKEKQDIKLLKYSNYFEVPSILQNLKLENFAINTNNKTPPALLIYAKFNNSLLALSHFWILKNILLNYSFLPKYAYSIDCSVISLFDIKLPYIIVYTKFVDEFKELIIKYSKNYQNYIANEVFNFYFKKLKKLFKNFYENTDLVLDIYIDLAFNKNLEYYKNFKKYLKKYVFSKINYKNFLRFLEYTVNNVHFVEIR